MAIFDNKNTPPPPQAKHERSWIVTDFDLPLAGGTGVCLDQRMVIDGSEVETGSFNFTKAAVTRNAENALLLRDVPELARAYEREWERLWGESAALGQRY